MTQQIIKFLTAGNVDDGKSTLIGRLLFDTDSLYQDQIDEVKKSTDQSFGEELDFSLFLDGLISERAQKITIDVAYRYFSHQGKKFIIADAPGHEQYTRNMAVAAANSDVVIILIDATKGVKTQTIRHSYIAHLFGIKNVIVAVNKMDLVNFDYEVFDQIQKNFLEKTAELNFDEVYFVPIAAISGENIVKKSDKISWYRGKSIVEYLHDAKVRTHGQNSLRLQVQNIVKHGTQRHYQGLLTSGEISENDEVMIHPTKKLAKISKIFHSNSEVKTAESGSSVSVILDQEIDLDRGGLISSPEAHPYFANHFSAHLIWFGVEGFAIKNSRALRIKINHNYLQARIEKINHIVDVNDPGNNAKQEAIAVNEIASVNVSISQETAFDLFKANKNTGSFLLIDSNNNETLACGVITNFLPKTDKAQNRQEQFLAELSELVRKYFGDKNIDFSI
jgi:sulfate adenylyltransferase subunit 1